MMSFSNLSILFSFKEYYEYRSFPLAVPYDGSVREDVRYIGKTDILFRPLKDQRTVGREEFLLEGLLLDRILVDIDGIVDNTVALCRPFQVSRSSGQKLVEFLPALPEKIVRITLYNGPCEVFDQFFL